MFGDDGRVFCGAAAIEPEVRDWARRCRYLHLATHGFFDLDNPMRSGLLLASPTALQVKGSEFDDVLYAYEMIDLRIGAELVVRMRSADAESALTRPHVRPMDFSGRPMKGWLYIATAGFAGDAELDGWVRAALAFVHEAGPKVAGKTRPMKRPPATKSKSRTGDLPRAGSRAAPGNRRGRGSGTG